MEKKTIFPDRKLKTRVKKQANKKKKTAFGQM